jgi:hypothetical protein
MMAKRGGWVKIVNTPDAKTFENKVQHYKDYKPELLKFTLVDRFRKMSYRIRKHKKAYKSGNDFSHRISVKRMAELTGLSSGSIQTLKRDLVKKGQLIVRHFERIRGQLETPCDLITLQLRPSDLKPKISRSQTAEKYRDMKSDNLSWYMH